MLARLFRIHLWCLIGALLGASYALAEEDVEPSEVSLVADHEAIAAQNTFRLALRIKLIRGWHVYWSNPGDSGAPASVTLTSDSAKRVELSEIRWPTPKKIISEPYANYGYEDEVLLPMRVRLKPGAQKSLDLSVLAKWVVCKELCLARKKNLALQLPIEATARQHLQHAQLLDAWYQRMPQLLSADSWLSVRDTPAAFIFVLKKTTAAEALLAEKDIVFFPAQDGWVEDAKVQLRKDFAERVELTVPKDRTLRMKIEKMSGLLVAKETGREGKFLSVEFRNVLVK